MLNELVIVDGCADSLCNTLPSIRPRSIKQGCHEIFTTKFHDFSMTFPWPYHKIPWPLNRQTHRSSRNSRKFQNSRNSMTFPWPWQPCSDSVSKTKIFLKKVSCPNSRHLKARLEQGYRIGLHWTVFQESCHNFWVSKMQLICLQGIADTVKVRKSIWNMFLH